MTHEERRKLLVQETIANFSDGFEAKDLLETFRKAMELVGSHQDWTGADKKKEVLAIVEEILAQTDTPKLPDFIIDPAIMWVASSAVDWIYDNLKDKFDFDGGK